MQNTTVGVPISSYIGNSSLYYAPLSVCILIHQVHRGPGTRASLSSPKAFWDSLLGNHSPKGIISAPGEPRQPMFQLCLALRTKAGDFGPTVLKDGNQVWLSRGLCGSSLGLGAAAQSDSQHFWRTVWTHAVGSSFLTTQRWVDAAV